MFAGLRSGEIRGLKYDDFDKEKQTIRIARQYTSNYFLAESNDGFVYTNYMEEKGPKADSYRLLHVPSFLFDELEKRAKFNQIILQNREKQGKKDLDYDYVSISAYGQRKKGNIAFIS